MRQAKISVKFAYGCHRCFDLFNFLSQNGLERWSNYEGGAGASILS